MHHQFLPQGRTINKECYIDTSEWVFGQKQNPNHALIIVFSGLVHADFFIFSKLKTPMKGKRLVTIEEIKERSKQELFAIPKSISRIGKQAGISVLYLRGVTFDHTSHF